MPLPKLLADANVAVEVVAFLRGRGVDVASIYERDLALLTDEDVLAVATAERRTGSC